MKKKLLFTILPLLLLSSCGGLNEAEAVSPAPIANNVTRAATNEVGSGEHVTYLMMSRYGYLDLVGGQVKPGTVEEKYYENCIVYKSEAGADLPGVDVVKTDVEGAKFRGWALYNDNVYPDYLTKVPDKSGMTVYAIYDGTTTSGGGSGGGGSVTTYKYGIMKSGTPMGATYKGESYGKEEYLLKSVSFAAGERFALYNYSTQATWTVNLNAYSFGDNDGTDSVWRTYLSKGELEYTVLKAFKGDLYIQIAYQADTLYIGLA